MYGVCVSVCLSVGMCVNKAQAMKEEKTNVLKKKEKENRRERERGEGGQAHCVLF